MPTLVVATQGARLRFKEGQALVEFEKRTLQSVPAINVERVLLMGRVGLSTAFIAHALAERMPITFLSRDGEYRGRLDTGGRGDIAARITQVRRLDEPAWRLDVSRSIVRAKVGAQRALLMRAHRNHGPLEARAAADDLERAMDDLNDAASLPALMGMEGRAARAYFKALPAAFRHPMAFRGRSRRPPGDPVNALLSLGYSLLTTEIVGALEGAGLDPRLGVFHGARRRVPALAEDVVEMFRAPVADRLALALVNLRVLRPDHFISLDTGGVALKNEPLQRYFREYRRLMQTTFRDREGRATSFRKEIQAHAKHLRRVILREADYEPFIAPVGGAPPKAAEGSR